ncbi:cell division protein FtsQ/DivIB [Pseudarthrobacter sp. R1]|uniref:cell division protein FtsQ/DivIB n=1 Tax=Pseudarthrobacter sp. R1 TaxID=2944934 RepID=UPI00210DC30D|nr:cell division protein FtsQ/DivIB [Pseudarthrobacter sp. R1]MCQ6270454.1 cell division protein FtsQ/DivIB [Pseudarthrobacter sp. R1]
MPSSRRPTYASTGRRPAGGNTPAGNTSAGSTPAGNAPGRNQRPGTAGRDAGSGPDVISASRPVIDPAPQSPKEEKKSRFAGRKKESSAEISPASGGTAGNVLAFPEPKGKRRKRKVLAVAATLVAVVAALLAAAVFSPVLAVNTISVSGTRLLTPAQVQAALEPLRGKPLPQITDEEVGRLLEPLVQVKSVSAEARPPSGLAVEVRERVPVALVKQGEQYQLVDVEGIQLAATDDPSSVSLPVIDGGAGTIGKELFRATAEVLGALPADVLAKLSNASAQSVDAVELKLVDGQTIIWGNAGEKELKAKVLAALLKVPADPKNPVKVYDVSVPRHPVTR